MPIANRSIDPEDYLDESVEVDDEALLEDDDEDIVPDRSSAVQAGWAAAKKAVEASSKFTTEFKFTEQQQLVKFVESEPFAVFNQHWLTRPGKKSFVCLGQDCPLCGIGDTPRNKTAFSVINLSAEEPVVEMLLTSPTLTRQLASFDSDPKTGPLDRIYWAMSKTGQGQKTVYSVIPVKARDLADDWGVDVATVEEIADRFEPLTSKVISLTPRSEMVELAREMSRS